MKNTKNTFQNYNISKEMRFYSQNRSLILHHKLRIKKKIKEYIYFIQNQIIVQSQADFLIQIFFVLILNLSPDQYQYLVDQDSNPNFVISRVKRTIYYNILMFKNSLLPYCLLLLLALAQSQPCQPQFLLQSVVQGSHNLKQTHSTSSIFKPKIKIPSQFTITLLIATSSAYSPLPSYVGTIICSHIGTECTRSIFYELFTQLISTKQYPCCEFEEQFYDMEKSNYLDDIAFPSRHSIQNQQIKYRNRYIAILPNSNSTLTLKSTINAQNVVYFSNILGVEAAGAPQYTLQVQSMKIGGQTVNILVSCNARANLTIQTIFFDASQNQFVYGYQKIPVSSINQFYGVWMQFAPVLYSLIGFNTLSFSGRSIQLDLSIDLVSSYLQISRSQSFSQLQLSFFSLGQIPSQVCAPCNNYISITGCLDSCPANSYPYAFSNGGKACRTCFQPLGQSLRNNECSCPNNQVYYQGNCYQPQNLPVKCPPDQLLIANTCYLKSPSRNCPTNSHASSDGSKCICDDGHQQYQSQCLKSCPERSTRTSFGLCACNYGYIMNSSKLCESICPPNSIYRQDFKQCVCNFGFEMVKGQCSQCPKGQFYNSATASCVVAFYSRSGTSNSLSVCQPNQIEVNGQCECDKKSIKTNGNCVACPQSTYKLNNAQCINCTNYCTQCENSLTCSRCQAGFNLVNSSCAQICGDGRRFTLQCDDGNTQNGDGCSSTCKIQLGYICSGGSPISTDACQKVDLSIRDLTIAVAGPSRYESCGIFTTFYVNPPLSRTSKQLYDMFRFTFSNAANPKGIVITQNDQDPSQITVFFDYKNSLVNAQFKVRVAVEQKPYGAAKIELLLDTLNNPTTSALADNYRNRRGNILQ